MTAVAQLIGEDSDELKWWCPGCESIHVVPVNQQGGWEWDGSLDAPTISPSILVMSHRALIDTELQEPALTNEANITTTPQCHSYVRAGQIMFLADCTHHLSDQTVPMAPITDRP